MPQNIYLTGFMGCGKSRIGALLAQALGRPFIDLDTAFAEAHGGISAGDFIRNEGEKQFRNEEQLLLRRLADEAEFTVIATGGGVPAYPGNRELMQTSGVTIFLDTPLEVIEKRLSENDAALRPLWSSSAAARRELYEERLPCYRQAEYCIDGTLPAESIISEFRNTAAKWLSKAPLKSRLFRQLQRQVAKDCSEFGLLAEGDRLLVGLSGGEDSMMLMHLLAALQPRLPFRIEIQAAVIDLEYPGFDPVPLQRYCEERGWRLHRVALPDFQQLLKEHDDGGLPCPVCSRLRRGKLHGLLAELNCNKLVLGHHLDDLCVSFMISLCRGGGLKTMGPNVAADGGKARLIRPLWGCRKRDLHAAAAFFNLPEVHSCPFEEQLEAQGDRAFFTRRLAELEARFPDVVPAMKHSMGDVRTQHLLDHKLINPQE